ncbi:hypothetical protein B0A55_10627 [Friedmanniomyces simplex]|uniref:Carboxylic ester hydrolase n=1 Tax=Friedmanniomyces simplex TaxID=329884 RepID=A0A4U0WLA6_9PEZI|nr:hypothetical protein B0A55_10627 [Friedmanniomyces simplex]
MMPSILQTTALLFTTTVLAGISPPWHGPHSGPWPNPAASYPATSSAANPRTTASCGYPGGAPTATIDAGVVVGTTTSLPSATASINKFLGVPFAKSPPTRFAPPESPGSFSEPINATAWSPACIQQFTYPAASQEFTEFVFNNPAPVESEDCLYLNVYAPSTPAPADGRAVLFWSSELCVMSSVVLGTWLTTLILKIYGGSLQFGNAGQPTYDGSWFASYEDVVVVTVNYRTNVFGFPSSPELPLLGHNLGFLDQRMGLDWTQRNIAAFGGSPDKVTIFGESAGAFSVDALLTSFPANSTPPFRGAIAESGQISYRPALSPSSIPAWDALSAALGCPGNYDSNLTCVRAANASLIRQIIDVQSLAFNPAADHITYMAYPAQQRLNGDIAYIPVMGGTNAQEGRVFTFGINNTSAYLQSLFGNDTALISALEAAYPLGQNGLATPYDQVSQIFTELVFQCGQAKWANDTAAIGIPAWRYYFNASFANTQSYPDLGVFHSSEIPIVFGTYAYRSANTTTQEYALSNAMRSAWARFAKNPMGGPGWNQVGTGSAGAVLVGAAEIEVGGVLQSANASVESGAWDLGVWGNREDVFSSGITVIDEYEVDYRCGLYEGLFAVYAGIS